MRTAPPLHRATSKTITGSSVISLVDNKSGAIDGDWQALRFVYRVSDR